MRRLALSLALLATPLAHAEVVTIGFPQLKELLARGTPVVDVRTAAEWSQSGVVAGSRTLTYFEADGSADPQKFMQQFSKIAGPDDEVVIICRSGARSAKVAAFLDQQMKYRKVYNVEGGVMGWKSAGNATVSP